MLVLRWNSPVTSYPPGEVEVKGGAARSSKTGRIPPTPAVFVRVANKELTAYVKWKCIRKNERLKGTPPLHEKECGNV